MTMPHVTVLSVLTSLCRKAMAMTGLALLACSSLEPAKDVVLSPDSRYPGWYGEVEACAGRTGDYRGIDWWVLEDDSPNAGETWGRDVYIKLRYATSAFVVKHEMLHTLLGGDGEHRSAAWRDCGLEPR